MLKENSSINNGPGSINKSKIHMKAAENICNDGN